MLISRILTLLAHFRLLFKESSLFRNSIYLMGSTVVMSIMGFGFWVFAAHLYTPSDIGNAAALISLSALLTNLSMLGINATLIRFLARSKDQSRLINAAIVVVGTATIVTSLVYLLISSITGNHASYFTSSSLHIALFALIMAAISINSLTDAVFIANRRAEFHMFAYGALGLVRLIAPLFLIRFGSWGIFNSYILATVVSLILSVILMRRTNGYRLFAKPDWSIIKKSRRYALNNYVGVLLAGVPVQIMPLLIIQNLGAAQAAFHSMAWTMANLIYVIPSAMTQSLLAETSSGHHDASKQIRQTVRALALILIPVVILAVCVAPLLLSIFGTQYSQGSTTLFQLFAFGTIFIAGNAVGTTILNIEHRSFGIILAQIATLVVTFGSVVWLWKYGLIGVGIATLLGLFASNVVHILLYIRKTRTAGIDALVTNTRPFIASPSSLKRMLERYNIRSFKVTQLVNGSNNHTFLVTTSAKKYVLRVYQINSRTYAQIQNEVAFMDALTQSGVPIPAVLKSRRGAKITQISLKNVTWKYIVMEYIEGTHPTSYSKTLIRNIAPIHASIHEAGLHYALTRNTTQRTQLRRIIHKSLPSGYSHFDFDASNILVSQSQTLQSVLDFEGMRYGPLWVCLYFSLGQIYKTQRNRRLISKYLDAYQSRRPLTKMEHLFISLALSIRYRNPSLLRI